MVEILLCLGSDLLTHSFIHIVVHTSHNVKVYVVQMSSNQTYDMEIELCTHCTINNTCQPSNIMSRNGEKIINYSKLT